MFMLICPWHGACSMYQHAVVILRAELNVTAEDEYIQAKRTTSLFLRPC